MSNSYDVMSKNNDSLSKYYQFLNERIQTRIDESHNRPVNSYEIKIYKIKIIDDLFKIPKISEFNYPLRYSLNCKQLDKILSFYSLKKSGNKSDKIYRIYFYLYYSYNAIKIQKLYKGFFQRRLNKLKGPALLNRYKCHNKEDFANCDLIEELSYDQFISYNDNDGFIYGFDIMSIYNLFLTDNINLIKEPIFHNEKKTTTQNPYNRKLFTIDFQQSVYNIIKYSKINKRKINLDYNVERVPIEQEIKFRTVALFNTIDNLGNYTNYMWFYNLNSIKLVKFMRELLDIWNYRAQLSMETKRAILPPDGGLYIQPDLIRIHNIDLLRENILIIIEKLVNCGIDRDYQSLGAYYILTALTIVSNEAAESLPWLYDSVVHN